MVHTSVGALYTGTERKIRMTKLQCHVIHCSSNKDHCCCRPEIQVEGKQACCSDETCCDSYTNILDNATNDVGYKTPNQSMPIACDAQKCVHNQSGMCAAESICVDGSSAHEKSQTVCSTFKCR